MSEEAADVLIIGAGPAGGVVAKALADAGRSVVCLEQGYWPDRPTFRSGDHDWELGARGRWHADPGVRRLPEDYPIDMGDSPDGLGVSNYNAVGGSATLYNGVWPRMTPANFAARSIRGYGEDWPISYDELAPYYARVDREFGVAGLAGNPAFPDELAPPLPPLPIQPGGQLLARAAAGLHWDWWPDYNAILSREHEGRHTCVQRGTCAQGCPEGAKGTTDLTHWPAVIAKGGSVRTGARVSRITLDAHGLACGAEWIDADGNSHFQPADVVVCAANAIGTPRLLLASACARFSDGLANGSGLVGRNLMFHSYARVTGLFEDELQSWRGQRGSWLGIWEFYESDERRGYVGTCKWQVAGTGGPLAQVLPAPGHGVWGENHHRRMSERLGRSVEVVAVGEELATVDNRVTLSADSADSSGLPAAKITYRISPNSHEMMTFHAERACELLTEAGATGTEVISPLRSAAHFMGTARMGDDPDASVVNRFALAHQIPNLAIVDGSVFVTSGGVNPTSTICALARRTADHLIQAGSRIPRPTHSRSAARPRRDSSPAETESKTPRKATPTPTGQEAPTPTGQARRELARIADRLIPGCDERPQPSLVGIADDLLNAVLRARPDLEEPLARALSHRHEDPLVLLARLADSDPSARDALELAVAGGYYMSPVVRRAIGYPGQVPLMVRPDPHPAYVEEGLLDHMFDQEDED